MAEYTLGFSVSSSVSNGFGSKSDYGDSTKIEDIPISAKGDIDAVMNADYFVREHILEEGYLTNGSDRVRGVVDSLRNSRGRILDQEAVVRNYCEECGGNWDLMKPRFVDGKLQVIVTQVEFLAAIDFSV